MTEQGSALAIAGYARQARALIPRYEAIDSAAFYAPVLDLLPDAPTRALDIGAGTGRDAAWLAAMGHRVVAVEPVATFLRAGEQCHEGLPIQWVDDRLPDLPRLHLQDQPFGLITLAGVWHHLDTTERSSAWHALARLAAPGGLLLMALRHGVCPADRPGHPTRVGHTIAAAKNFGFRLIRRADTDSLQPENQRAGVTWTWLALHRKGRAT